MLRIREGLDAVETKFFVHEGKVVSTHTVVDWRERRQYVELAARFGGYYVDRQEIELADQTDDLPVEQLIKKAEELLAALKETTHDCVTWFIDL